MTGGYLMTMTVRETFDRGTAAFNAHDMDGFAGLMADDVVLRAPGGMRSTGRQECAEFFGAWLSAFPDAHVAIRDVQVCDDVAVEEGTFAGTHEGVLHTPAGDIEPTGRRVEVPYMQAIWFRDGKEIAIDLMYDRLELLEQLGLLPAAEE
jgi:uncharacterized protein (TIGR02246 family)